MATFREKENYCQRTFDENGPYWHLYTSGKETPLMFRTEDDYVFAMNVIAQMAFEYHDIRILTFEIMGNHIHILAEGQASDCIHISEETLDSRYEGEFSGWTS